jgi:hypothetical protein
VANLLRSAASAGDNAPGEPEMRPRPPPRPASEKPRMTPIKQAGGLQDQLAYIRVQGVLGVGPVVKAVAVSAGRHQIQLHQFLQVLLDGAQGKACLPPDLPHVQFFFVQAEKLAKDFRSHPGGQYITQGPHNCLVIPNS